MRDVAVYFENIYGQCNIGKLTVIGTTLQICLWKMNDLKCVYNIWSNTFLLSLLLCRFLRKLAFWLSLTPYHLYMLIIFVIYSPELFLICHSFTQASYLCFFMYLSETPGLECIMWLSNCPNNLSLTCFSYLLLIRYLCTFNISLFS